MEDTRRVKMYGRSLVQLKNTYLALKSSAEIL